SFISVLASPIQHLFSFFFFFNHPAPTEIYTLSLHDALPIFYDWADRMVAEYGYLDLKLDPPLGARDFDPANPEYAFPRWKISRRSEEHTSELQSRGHLVCRLLLEKKKNDASVDEHRSSLIIP